MESPSEIKALHCADCARSESAVTDLAPSAILPIPAEALVGFPEGSPEERRYDRRSLLKHGIVGMASVYAATRLDWGSIWEEATAHAAEPMQRSLVCVFLNGGNDGVNTVVPVSAAQYAAYVAARPTLARLNVGGATTPSTATQVGTTVLGGSGASLAFANIGVSGAGNNGDTKGFDTLYGDGSGGAGSDLAVFPGTGYLNQTRSHFDGRDIWFRGTTQMTQTGWLGRWLDAYGSKVNPLQAVSLDSSLSKQIRSNSAPVSALDNLNGVRFDVPNVDTSDPTAEIGSLATVPAGASNEALNRSRSMFGLTVDVSNRLKALTSGAQAAGYPPNSQLSTRLQLAATLLSAGLGTRIITIDWGSFDNHGTQLPSHDPQLSILSRALGAFKADLAARGIEQNVCTLVFSEFGRQVYENDSDGTDHGEGGLMMVTGSVVKGGYAGEFPGIPAATQSDSLSFKTDFRTVYQSLVSEWLGGDPAAVLPGAPFPVVQRYDGGTGLFVGSSLMK